MLFAAPIIPFHHAQAHTRAHHVSTLTDSVCSPALLAAGISAVTFYAADIFQRAGLDERADQLATFRECPQVDTVSRRPSPKHRVLKSIET